MIFFFKRFFWFFIVFFHPVVKADENFLRDFYKEHSESSVGVITLLEQTGLIMNNQSSERMGTATGFFVSKDGLIVTNCHCISVPNTELKEIKIILSPTLSRKIGEPLGILEAEVVGEACDYDIALLRLKTDYKDFPAVKLRDKPDVSIGDDVFSIGNPSGSPFVLGKGYVYSTNVYNHIYLLGNFKFRHIGVIMHGTEPGSSGSAVFNRKGEVVGVINAGKDEDNIVIPSDIVHKSIDMILNKRGQYRAWIGANVALVHPRSMYLLDVPISSYRNITHHLNIASATEMFGVYVTDVVPQSPADLFGLRSGDIIYGIEDEFFYHVVSYDNLMRINSEPNKRMKLLVYRDGEHIELLVAAQDRKDRQSKRSNVMVFSIPQIGDYEVPIPDQKDLLDVIEKHAQNGAYPKASFSEKESFNFFGIKISEVILEGYDKALFFVSSSSRSLNLRYGTLIQKIDNKTFDSIGDLIKYTKKSMKDKSKKFFVVTPVATQIVHDTYQDIFVYLIPTSNSIVSLK